MAFSLSFDPRALTYEGAAPGEQIAQAQFNINESEAAAGRLAVVLGFSPGRQGFAQGLRELVKVNFRATAQNPGAYPIELTDQPVLREVCDATGSALGTTYQPGVIIVEACPTLRFTRSTGGLTLSWPLWATNATLERAEDPWGRSGTWTHVSASPVSTNGEWSVTLPQTNTVQYYRLKGR